MISQPPSRFRSSLLKKDEFTLTFELVPSRGGRSREHSKALAFAYQAAIDGRLAAVSLTENAGGHAALSPEVLGTEISAMNLDVIIHFSCKDKNRNQMESLLSAWDRLGLKNLLVLAGDYPKEGYQGRPKPVFDIDTIQALHLIGRMNQGIFGSGKVSRVAEPAEPTTFFRGVVVSPFKHLEAELMMQYAKLHRKVAAGARFVITQLGFDARKFQEVLLYMEQNGLDIPVLGNVFIPNLPVAELMYKGEIPGCVIPDRLYQLMHEEAQGPGKGKEARLLRAAKLLAVLRGIGYAGAHIGGPALSFSDIAFIMDKAENFFHDWQACIPDLDFWPAASFFYFLKDPQTGLNQPTSTLEPTKTRPPLLSTYAFLQWVHTAAFAQEGSLYPGCRKLCLAMDRSRLSGALSHLEHTIKFLAFGCQNCGDCTLAELAFFCPQSGCAKYLLNGACGGSLNGWCEVYPGKKRCLYVRVYERLKKHRRLQRARSGYVPPRDWALNNTSSWVNFYSGLDHTADKENTNGK